MEQKRFAFLSLIALIFLVASVAAFGGGGGGGSSTPSKPVASFDQGASVTINWNIPYYANSFEPGAPQPRFVTIYISVYDPNGAVATSQVSNSNTGSFTWNIPSNAVLGGYSIETYADYTDDVNPQTYSNGAYESTTQNTIFAVTSAPATYLQGDSVPIGWYMTTYEDGQAYGQFNVMDSQGNNVFSCNAEEYGTAFGEVYGSCTYTIAGNAPTGSYTIYPASCSGTCSYPNAFDGNTGKNSFNVASPTVPAGNNPGDPCGTGNTCNNGLQCQSGTCKQINVNTGGQCDANRLCSSGLTCSAGTCVNPNAQTADQAAFGVVDGVYSDKYARGWARDPDWQAAGQHVEIHFYIDNVFAGSTIANQPSEGAVGGNGNHRFAWMIPQQYWNNQQHELWGYAIGRTNTGALSGNNPQLGSPSYQSRIFTFSPPPVTCTSFGYSSWSACSNGQQTRTITSSSPSGCSGGTPAPLTQSCTAGNGGVCSSNSHCSSGLECVNNVCSDPTPQVHSECRNMQCVQVDGAGTNLCSVTADCLRPQGGQCDANYGCQAGLQCTNGACQPLPTQQITSAKWTNMNRANLGSADNGDTLLMVADGLNLQLNGGEVAFRVYKKQALIDSLVETKTVTITSSAIASTNSTFKPTEAGTYYFKANAGSSERTSGDAVVASSTSNALPTVSITSPQSGGVYYTGNNVQFSHSSYDVDDTISSVRWTFGDGTSSTANAPTKSYSTAGQKLVTLEVTDSRGAKATQSVTINLANQNGYTLFAVIETPSSNAAIVSSNLAVDYSARESYVINTVTTGSSPCTVTVTCVQGQCPSTTRASPSCASNPNNQVAITGGAQGYSQIFFNWTFRDGSSMLSPESGNGKVSGTKGFSDHGIKNITLTARYTGNSQNLASSFSRGFTLFNQRQCSVDGATWNKVENGLVTETRDTLSTAACAGVDLQAGTGDDCCPLGFTCSTSGVVGCRTDSQTQSLGCGSYATESACSADSSNRARNELLWDYYDCGKSVDGKNILCSCGWNNQRSQCELQKSDRSDSDPLSGTLAQCSYATQTSQCVDGYQNVQIDASVIGGGESPECSDSTQILPCGRPVVALPFFTAANAIIAILVIAAIYFLTRKKKQ